MDNSLTFDISSLVFSFLSPYENITVTSLICKNCYEKSRESVIHFKNVSRESYLRLMDHHLKLFPNLKKINLCGNDFITNNGIKHLKRLERLDISFCDKVTDVSILKRLKIVIARGTTCGLNTAGLPNYALIDLDTKGNKKIDWDELEKKWGIKLPTYALVL
jgi:hypothetical protein